MAKPSCRGVEVVVEEGRVGGVVVSPTCVLLFACTGRACNERSCCLARDEVGRCSFQVKCSSDRNQLRSCRNPSGMPRGCLVDASRMPDATSGCLTDESGGGEETIWRNGELTLAPWRGDNNSDNKSGSAHRATDSRKGAARYKKWNYSTNQGKETTNNRPLARLCVRNATRRSSL